MIDQSDCNRLSYQRWNNHEGPELDDSGTEVTPIHNSSNDWRGEIPYNTRDKSLQCREDHHGG
jgi:hypothetical protein